MQEAPLPGPLHHHDLIIIVHCFLDFHGLGSPHMVWAHHKRWAGKAEGIEWP